jgi:hypothetical protein
MKRIFNAEYSFRLVLFLSALFLSRLHVVCTREKEGIKIIGASSHGQLNRAMHAEADTRLWFAAPSTTLGRPLVRGAPSAAVVKTS